ncbi:MAG: hypothetical protein ABEJ75_04460 [Candidatus Nanohaloarchaea archaeon]
MASNQEIHEIEEGPEEFSEEPSIDEYVAGESILYVDDVFEPEDLSAEAVREELESRPEETAFYISPDAFARILERDAGQHQAYLYDESEEERPDEPELNEAAEQGIKEVAEILAGLPADTGRIDTVVYEREGDPRYIHLERGEVSVQALEKFWKSLPAELEADLGRSRKGYTIEF